MRARLETAWSTTERDLRDQLRACREAGTAAALVTAADVEGSTYRRPGAKMLVPVDGADTVGAVTAGCLEEPVQDLAGDVVAEGDPRLSTFDLTDEGDSWGLGLGCSGVIDLFVEPLDGSVDAALEALGDGDPVTVITVVAGTGTGRRSLVTRSGTREAVTDREPVPTPAVDAVADTVDRLHGTGETLTVEVTVGDRTMTVLIDSLQPVPELLLFGSQNDLLPLAALATEVGFRVGVHSPRGAVDDDTVPAADRVVTGHPATIDETVTATAYTYAVVMSHNIIDDRIAVRTLLRETSVPYVGLMGPRKRFRRLRDGLAENGVTLTGDELDRISTPVGLDLGGGEPREIALSAVSEVLAVSNDCSGGRLRDRSGPIHPRVSSDGG